MLTNKRPIRIEARETPILIVVIDTEEEFDWTVEPKRESNSVLAMREIDKVQCIFDEYSIIPCYVVDYPVVSKKEGYELLKQIHNRGGCEIGAHLQPWVNPPYDEELTRRNTFPGNLSKALEREKLKVLGSSIKAKFGIQPKIYKAGRYGVGQNTASILEELGYEIDVSICPSFDFSEEGGPNFTDFDCRPYWFGNSKILEIPLTSGFVGWAGTASKPLYKVASKLNKLKVPGILSRISAVDRLLLSPEGFNHDEHIKITKFLYDRGIRIFTWSFHSPSVVPGCTPYVRNDLQLHHFLDSFHKYFDYFFTELKGEASTLASVRRYLAKD